MVRSICCGEEKEVKRGPWTAEEDDKLREYINNNGFGNWRSLPKLAGLNRCGKSCRLRWLNYLRPDIRRGSFSHDEERLIVNLHAVLGNKWSKIANHLPGRTDNEIKNYWNTHIRKKLMHMGIDPITHKPTTDLNNILSVSNLLAAVIANAAANRQFVNNTLFKNNALEDVVKIQLLHNILQMMNPISIPIIGSFNTNVINPKPKPTEGPINVHDPQLFTNPFESITQTNMDFWSSLGNFCETEVNRSEPVGTGSSWDNLKENRLPALVSISNEDSNSKPIIIVGNDQYRDVPSSISVFSETPGFNQTGTNQLSSGLDTFETWQKLLDDETNDSCWKSFLDLTSPELSHVAW